MFKAIRISVLLLVLLFVAVNAWLSEARSTDWNNSLWVKIYPINADGSDAAADYIGRLELDHFAGIETFIAREAERYGKSLSRPLRMELGREIREQPPAVEPNPDAFVINIGDVVQVWSNDRYPAPLHRVIASAQEERYSAPYFFNPSYAANYAPLSSPPHYRPINWGEFRAGRAAGDYADHGEEIQISHFRTDGAESGPGR